MDLQVISFVDRKYIDFQGLNYIFKEEDKDKAYIKEYYLFNGRRIEILFIEKDKYINVYSSRNIKKTVILTNKVQKHQEKYISRERSIIFTGDKSSGRGHAILLNQLLNKEQIHLKALIMLIYDNEVYRRINDNRKIDMMIVGSEKRDKVITNIVMNTLKEISLIERCSSIELVLYTNREFLLSELINIEDPIYEYINCGKLKIKQCLCENKDESIYYMVIAATE